MAMPKALHLRYDINRLRGDRNRLHVPRKERGKRHASIEDYIDASIQGLKDYIKKSQERLLTAANKNIDNIRIYRKTTKTMKQK